MKYATLLRSGAAVLTLSLATFAYHQYEEGSLDPLNQLYPGPLGMANFGKVVSGNFNGLGRLDAVVMDGAMPKLVISPATHDNAVSVGMYANDIAMIPSTGGSAKDSLLTVGADGLVRHTRNSTTGDWTHFPLEEDDWIGARLVGVAQLDDTPNMDIVGIAANGHEILILSANTLHPTYSALPSINVPVDNIYGLVLLNWKVVGDIAGTKEIAVVTEDGVVIYEINGTAVGVQAWASTTNKCAAVKSPHWLSERLLEVDMVNGQEQMCVWAPNGTIAGPYPLGLPGIVSVATGDRDGDGDSDVVFGVNTQNKLHVHTNNSAAQQSTPLFDPANVLKLSYGTAGRDPEDNHAGTALADFDNDGMLDALAPAQGDLVGAIAHYGTLPVVQLGVANPLPHRIPISSIRFLTDTSPQQIEVTFTAPTQTLAAGPDGPARIGLSVYYTPDLGVGTQATTYTSTFLTMPTTGTPTVYVLTMPPTYSADTDPGIYTLAYHQVATDDDVIVAESAMRLALITGNYNGPILKGSATAGNWFPGSRIPIGEDPWTGGAVYDPAVPPTDPDLEPVEPDK
jgi:hypothetical protein